MPIKKAAKKFSRVTKRKTAINQKTKKAMRLSIKKFSGLLTEKDPQKMKAVFMEAQQKIDKAAKAGLIKKNTAARKKSRLVRKIKNLEKK